VVIATLQPNDGSNQTYKKPLMVENASWLVLNVSALQQKRKNPRAKHKSSKQFFSFFYNPGEMACFVSLYPHAILLAITTCPHIKECHALNVNHFPAASKDEKLT